MPAIIEAWFSASEKTMQPAAAWQASTSVASFDT
jgi:hypothetical protein